MNERKGPHVIRFRSIRSLYPLALAEGEGAGTAYEYFAKRLVLRDWLRRLPRVDRLLVAGLPEKYGVSLDFFVLAEDLGVGAVVVVDDRPAALEKLAAGLAAARARGALARLSPELVLTAALDRLDEVTGPFDAAIGSEVVQRLPADGRPRFATRLAALAPRVALFAPNGENPAHTSLSGLAGLELPELRALVARTGDVLAAGYVDIPPFPPGLTRSAAQRAQAESGPLARVAMWALGHYARLERFMPRAWGRGHAHIVYALGERSA